ncbi:MAG: hypothetical protein IJF71_05575 [Clostridia bacterium]|nr:hypothetical protein [Clostridia bacterium]
MNYAKWAFFKTEELERRLTEQEERRKKESLSTLYHEERVQKYFSEKKRLIGFSVKAEKNTAVYVTLRVVASEGGGGAAEVLCEQDGTALSTLSLPLSATRAAHSLCFQVPMQKGAHSLSVFLNAEGLSVAVYSYEIMLSGEGISEQSKGLRLCAADTVYGTVAMLGGKEGVSVYNYGASEAWVGEPIASLPEAEAFAFCRAGSDSGAECYPYAYVSEKRLFLALYNPVSGTLQGAVPLAEGVTDVSVCDSSRGGAVGYIAGGRVYVCGFSVNQGAIVLGQAERLCVSGAASSVRMIGGDGLAAAVCVGGVLYLLEEDAEGSAMLSDEALRIGRGNNASGAYKNGVLTLYYQEDGVIVADTLVQGEWQTGAVAYGEEYTAVGGRGLLRVNDRLRIV